MKFSPPARNTGAEKHLRFDFLRERSIKKALGSRDVPEKKLFSTIYVVEDRAFT
jgi:hypothetical protein